MGKTTAARRPAPRTATPEELAKGGVSDLERRLTALEERLNPATDYGRLSATRRSSSSSTVAGT